MGNCVKVGFLQGKKKPEQKKEAKKELKLLNGVDKVDYKKG